MRGKRRYIVAQQGEAWVSETSCFDQRYCFTTISLVRAVRTDKVSWDGKKRYRAEGRWMRIKFQGNFSDNGKAFYWYGASIDGSLNVQDIDITLTKKIREAYQYNMQPEELLHALGAIMVEFIPADEDGYNEIQETKKPPMKVDKPEMQRYTHKLTS